MRGVVQRRIIAPVSDENDMGGKFWLLIIGGAIACAVVGVIGLLLIGAAWARWGFLGMFLLLSLILLGIGWWSDRREQKRRSSFE
jgi:membrane protein implicated in regulation of membrane protease activity